MWAANDSPPVLWTLRTLSLPVSATVGAKPAALSPLATKELMRSSSSMISIWLNGFSFWFQDGGDLDNKRGPYAHIRADSDGPMVCLGDGRDDVQTQSGALGALRIPTPAEAFEDPFVMSL